MLTTRSRKNGNSIVVTLPIFNGVKQEPDKEYIVVYGEDDTITLIPKLEDPFAHVENGAYYQEDVWEEMPAVGIEVL